MTGDSMAPEPQKMEQLTAEQVKEDLDAMLGHWQKQTCDVTFGCPLFLYSPSGTQTITRDEQGRYTFEATMLVNGICCCWAPAHVLLDLPLILLKPCGNVEPVMGRVAAFKSTQLVTAEEAMAPHTSTLVASDPCRETARLTVKSAPIDRYTTISTLSDRNAKQFRPVTTTFAPDFQSYTQTSTIEGCQGACTCVPCSYTQTAVWKKVGAPA